MSIFGNLFKSQKTSIDSFPEFVTTEEANSLSNSIYSQFDQMLKTLNSLEGYMFLSINAEIDDEVMIVVANEIRGDISSLKEKINNLLFQIRKNNNDQSEAFKIALNKIKNNVDNLTIKAKRQEALYRLRLFNKDLTSMLNSQFHGTTYEFSIDKEKIDTYYSRISRIQVMEKKARESEKIFLEKNNGQFKEDDPLTKDFHQASFEAEYRICLLKIIHSIEFEGTEINPFSKSVFCSPRKEIFLELFRSDLSQTLEKYYDIVEKHANLLKERCNHIMIPLEQDAKEIGDILELEDCEDPLLESIISKLQGKNSDYFFRVVVLLLRIKRNLNIISVEYDKIKQEEYDELIKKQDLEKKRSFYAKMTDSEINSELRKIKENISSNGEVKSQYIEMLDFQKEVAVAKGLLPQSALNPKYGVCVDAIEAYQFLQQLNRTGSKYLVYPDGQEYGDTLFSFELSKTIGDEYNQSKINKQPPSIPFIEKDLPRCLTSSIVGQIPDFLLQHFYDLLLNGDSPLSYETVNNYLFVMHDENSTSQSIMYKLGIRSFFPSLSGNVAVTPYIVSKVSSLYNKFIENIKLTESGDKLKNVLSYIYFPADRNMIPILKALQAAGIDYYFEPIPENLNNNRNNNHRNNIHIYYRREQDNQVSNVLKQFSNGDNGIIFRAWTPKNITSFGSVLANEMIKEKDHRLYDE